MSQVCAIPEVNIGDLLEIKSKSDYRIYELDDIAVLMLLKILFLQLRLLE